jgi:PAS domain S-box-containing protein
VKKAKVTYNYTSANIVIAGIVIAISFWVIDAFVDAVIFEEGDFATNIFNPGLQEVWLRLVVMGLIVGMSVIGQKLFTRRTRTRADIIMFRNLMKQTSDAVFVVDPEEGRFLDVNDRACKNMGYDRKELLNMGVMDIKTDVPEDFLWEKLIREVKKEGFKVFESMHVRKDGTKFPVEVNVVYVNQGKREFMVAMARDITLRKKVEKAVMSAVLKAEDESAKSEAIIASMGDGISIHDKTATVSARAARWPCAIRTARSTGR